MMKNMLLRPLACLVLAVLLNGCQKEELLLQTADLQAESQAASTAEASCDVIDFERVAEYPRDGNKFVTGVLSQKGLPVKVRALSRYSRGSWDTQNRANIANSAAPGDWDRDLKTPNWNL